MYDFLNIVIVLILAQFAIYFCYILSIQLEKILPAIYRPYLYLFAGSISFFQILKLALKFKLMFYKTSVLYFWVVFLVGMLVLFVKERKKIIRNEFAE
jgi:hypothetical protein